jgi:NAD(P)-dependent dehydrogenase (short-subunit alcohol dehydrogenase family)
VERLEGSVAIVSGGNRGIGLATSRLFAERGVAVVIAARDEASGEAAAASTRAAGGRALYIRADVSRVGDIDRVVRIARETFGGIDILVNNAAVDPWKPLLETEEADWDACLGVNLKGSFFLAKACVPEMLARGGGVIVNTSSILALGALARSGAYVASKAGVMGLTRAMVVEWTPLGIRVNCIIPGSTDTDMMWYGLTPDEIPAERVATAAFIPAGRIADPDEIARATLWLCGPEAAFASGAFLVLDGGLTARSPSPR